MVLHGIELPLELIAGFCRHNGIRRLSVFGSIVRDDFRPESDIDILVEFDPDVRVGLRFVRLEEELSAMLGRRVDLHTPASLSKYFRNEALGEARDVYVAA